MPYQSKDELPDSVKELPAHGQDIFLKTFNAVIADKDEETAFKFAWAAVKKIYRKEGDKWVKREDYGAIIYL